MISEIDDNLRCLERVIIVSLPLDRAPREQEVLEMASRLRIAFPVPDGEFAALLRELYAKLPIQMDK